MENGSIVALGLKGIDQAKQVLQVDALLVDVQVIQQFGDCLFEFYSASPILSEVFRLGWVEGQCSSLQEMHGASGEYPG